MVEMITLSPVEQVPPDSRVYHYDELPERAKECLPCLIEVDEQDVSVPKPVCTAFESFDIVKFTDYYRITVHEEPPSTPGVC